MWMIVFVGWLTYEQLEAGFREGEIVRKLHHRNYPTCRDGDRCRIVETAVRKAKTTSRISYISPWIPYISPWIRYISPEIAIPVRQVLLPLKTTWEKGSFI